MKRASLLLCSILFVTISVFGGVTGSIIGTVTDTMGGIISGATVVALNVETGVKNSTQTNAQGVYSFPALPVGHYSVQIQATGFSEYRQTGLVLDVNSALRVDATLQVGEMTEHIEVSSSAVQVATESTQMGEVIGGQEMVSLPLDGRDYTELMALQPGVVPYSTTSINWYSPGISGGTLSVSGGRENANGFMVNGGNVQEAMQNGASVIPNLDSIAEFRILTNNFDAEYGHYSGGVVNVVTKSGTNKFHGDAFEFLRNTNLDARNYYSLERNDFRQNQFGGTFGGPIVHDRLFFFTDYQGTRQTLGGAGFTPVPSAADREGNLADQSSFLTGTVTGTAFANTLSQSLGYPVSVGEPFYTSSCTTSATCVFPNAIIPKSAWSAPASGLLPYIPLPNVPASADFPTGAYSNSTATSNSTLQDDKGGFRIDANTGWGMLAGYYHIDDYTSFNPDAFSVGGIGSTASRGRSQLITFSDTKTFSTSSLNEFRLSYMRNAAFGGAPATAPIDPASVGFTVGCDTLGLCPLSQFQTVPYIGLNSFGFGGPGGGNNLRENTYQVQDNYSKILGTHSLKVGGIYSLSQANMQTYISNNGGFGFTGSAETGLDFADFLLGAPSDFSQGIQLPLYSRGRYYGVYAQDSWRVRRNLTFNYGLRWDVTTPWWEKYNKMEALVPGLQSATFPTAPLGWDFPGDPGVPTTVAPTRYGNIAPRVGLAYSPDPQGGVLRKLTGGAGKTSIRASWGMFYTDLEDFTNANGNGDAPYGYWWASPTPPMFATPYVDLWTGNVEGQRFPIPSTIANASPSNPDPNVNWAQFEPISSSPTYYHKNEIPYSENYMLSLQRELGAATLLSVSYVGTQGHHLMVIFEANPSTPSVCLSVSQPSQVAPGSNTCGPFSETGTFTAASGQVIQARQQLGPNGGTNFGSDGWFRTMGNSSYNALQVSLRHTTHRLSLLAGYTYSKSMDNSSTPTDQVNPFNPHLSKALSAFDMMHNFVVSYSYELPFDKAFRPNRLTRGWILSGITRFATGFPITIIETDDRSLIGNISTGPSGSQDEPNYVAGQLLLQTNPRLGGTYFNTFLFSPETLGQFGNANRRFFHGPGINNWDIALLKNVQLRESMTLQFRAELFNAFNHSQFNNPDGNINDSTFGVIQSAGNPRIGQLAVKFLF
ncbi:MAG TPA: carboxypeptidase regulatory-like domain-containing protein [Terriglobia bacterium]|nr:carboxypeptidase regulatory-like domain-containing protein [Terriglobia bacterium]